MRHENASHVRVIWVIPTYSSFTDSSYSSHRICCYWMLQIPFPPGSWINHITFFCNYKDWGSIFVFLKYGNISISRDFKYFLQYTKRSSITFYKYDTFQCKCSGISSFLYTSAWPLNACLRFLTIRMCRSLFFVGASSTLSVGSSFG